MVDQVEQDKKKVRRERSPNYPSLTLTEALGLARKLWDKEKRTPVAPDVAAKAWDYTSLSGPARAALAALRQYGLLESDPKHGVHLSDLAINILHQPEGSPERQESIQAAAMAPKLIRELVGTHADASDDALKAYLITKRKFSEDGARRLIRSFRDALALANLEASGYNGDVKSTPQSPSSQGPNAPEVLSPIFGKPKVALYTFPLAKGLTAEVRFIGEEVQPSHIDRLKKYLETARDAVATDGNAGEKKS